MTVVVFAVGVALVVWSIALSLFYASVLRRRGESPRRALRLLVRRPTIWIGIVLVVAAVNPLVAGVLGAVYVVLAALYARRLIRRRR
jgi:uncharacterized membrane protein